jgi:hypothetical protein
MMTNNYFYFGDIVAFESRQVLKNKLVRLPEGYVWCACACVCELTVSCDGGVFLSAVRNPNDDKQLFLLWRHRSF